MRSRYVRSRSVSRGFGLVGWYRSTLGGVRHDIFSDWILAVAERFYREEELLTPEILGNQDSSFARHFISVQNLVVSKSNVFHIFGIRANFNIFYEFKLS